MASHPVPLEVEVTISSAKDLKNVNWRHGNLKPYAVVWVDPNAKHSTNVDEDGDTSPVWDETLAVPIPCPIEDSTLSIDIVHANAKEDTKPLIGSARVPLREILDDVGIGEKAFRTLQLKRPSGRPQGKIEAKITVRDPRYRAPDPYYASPYGVPPPSRDYHAPTPYGYPYAAPPPVGYQFNPPQYGTQALYGQPAYGHETYGGDHEKKSKYGMGTGLAVGAVAGVLGGVALAEGADYVEDKIADDVAEKVEDDIGYDDDDGGFGGGSLGSSHAVSSSVPDLSSSGLRRGGQILGFATFCAAGSSSFLAEVLAICLRIVMAFQWRLSSVTILIDAKTVGTMFCIEILYAPRQHTLRAHDLAKAAVIQGTFGLSSSLCSP
ncbi:hypothetical protein HHK36_032940 [Tetracentron sinense]|uniref:C2 domain-containing protein n=1 Tax=Tetracentron sinense TaxID=13715 RepID=A0A835CX60_TETSI|nr:hypothetical protein HHK36_032940 [Tetracentron sinense]